MNRDYFPLAPNLDVLVDWSPRTSDLLHQCYRMVIYRREEASEQQRQDYDRWCRAKEGAYTLIQQLFTLTGSLPVAGDYLLPGGDRGDGLRIDKRTLFSMPDSPSLLLVYEIGGEHLDDLEAQLEDILLEEQK